MSHTYYVERWQHYQARAELAYTLDCFGDYLARMHGYPSAVAGFEAIYLYLCNKYHWPITRSRVMAHEDIRLALALEMEDWSLPPEAQVGEWDRTIS
ncbi:hypothetical protein NMD70_08400 [Edwardsiella tarda]|uniref:hypothetical protein n=1 Tax=Edwardsiella tarda TaxID=636 RepID=UPI00351BF234